MQPLARDRIRIALCIAIAALGPSSLTTLPSLARAQCGEGGPDDPVVAGCHEEPVEFHFREGFLDSVMLDTGWVPAGSPLQVRFALYVGGETEIDLAGTSFTWWPRPLTVRVPGTPGTGRLSIDYGLEFVARVRFDVTVAGTRYTWEGDIPTGSIPRDLRMAAMTAFDSMLLSPQTPRPVTISDATEPIEAINYDLGGLIGIPGVGGGFALDVEGVLAASYRTDRIEIGDAPLPITEEGASTVAGPDDGATDFGASKDVVIGPVGSLDYDGTVNLHPVLYVEVPGRRFDLMLPDVAIPLVSLAREVRFDPATVHVPLPDARIVPRSFDFGEVEIGTTATQLIEVRNEGEATLLVTPRAPRAPFAIATDTIMVPPRSARSVEVSFVPELPETTEAMLFLGSNDPDESLVVVRLSGTGTEPALADGGLRDAGPSRPGGSTDGGCGCRAGAPGSLPAWALALSVAFALVIRRRRR